MTIFKLTVTEGIRDCYSTLHRTMHGARQHVVDYLGHCYRAYGLTGDEVPIWEAWICPSGHQVASAHIGNITLEVREVDVLL